MAASLFVTTMAVTVRTGTVTVEGLTRKVSVVTVIVALGWKSTPPPVVAEACSYARALVMMAPTAMKATASALMPWGVRQPERTSAIGTPFLARKNPITPIGRAQ